MAGVRFTGSGNYSMRLHGLRAYDIIEIISQYEVIQENILESGLFVLVKRFEIEWYGWFIDQ